MANGFVVDHMESGVRYAISEHNFNEKVHRKVRNLRPGETVIGFQPKRKDVQEGSSSPAPTEAAAEDQVADPADRSDDPPRRSGTHTTPKPVTPESK